MTDENTYREQLRKHIAAIDGRRPQDGHSERGFSTCPHPDCVAQHDGGLNVNGVPPNPPNLTDAAEMLWVVLANVSEGDWTKQLPVWQEAAARWRDYYFQALSGEAKARQSEGGNFDPKLPPSTFPR